MGNQNCMQNFNNLNTAFKWKTTKIDENYSFYNKKYDCVFENIYLYQSKNSEEIIFKIKFKLYDEKEFNFFKEKYILELKSKYYFELIDYSIIVKNNIINNYYWISLFFKYPEINLYNNILLDSDQNYLTNNIDLTILTYNMIDALEFLEINKVPHNDFTFNLISYERIKEFPYKKFVLYNNFKKSLYYNYFEKIIKNKLLFCSPHIFFLIANEFKDINIISKFKNNVFILGLIIWKITLREKFLSLYFIKKGKYIFEKNNLIKMIKIFISTFYQKNKFICLIIKELLVINENERLFAKDLKQKIPSYNLFLEKIVNKF